MKAKLKEVERGMVYCLSSLLKELKQKDARIPVGSFSFIVSNTEDGGTDGTLRSVEISAHIKKDNTLHIAIDNISDIDYPKETAKEFWERLGKED